MGRFEPTSPIGSGGYSVQSLRWENMLGALGPSDGSKGAASNVPSALSVVRHAHMYLPFPDEIEEAFAVLETHAMRDGQLYPVALATLPFLFATMRAHSPIGERVAELIARYTAASNTLDEDRAIDPRGQLPSSATSSRGMRARHYRSLGVMPPIPSSA